MALALLGGACIDDDDGGAGVNGATAAAGTATAPAPGTEPMTATPSAGAAATGGVSTELARAVVEVVDRARPSVVQVTNQQALSGQPQGALTQPGGDETLVPAGVGSGVIIDDEGHILTNNHVIQGAANVTVHLTDGRDFDAEVVGRDPRTDLAVLRIEGDDLSIATLGASGELRVGEWVVAIGNALGLVGGPTVTTGVVSAVGRTVQGPPSEDGAGTFFFDVIQTDAAINPGNSGGPLLNLEGEVIGINTLGAGSGGQVPIQGISFAIAIDTAIPLAQEMIQTGTVAHPYLGIAYAPLNPAIANQLGAPVSRGALIRDVVPDSPADEAGLQAGDIVVEVDGDPVEGETDFPAALNELDAGDEVDLTVRRGEETVTLTATLGEAPPPGESPAP